MQATPAPEAASTGIRDIDLPPGLSPAALADLLVAMPEHVAGLSRRRVQAGADNATVIYLAGEETARPAFGLVVALIVPSRDDADAAITELHRERWGDPADHTITASGSGDAATPAFREFWRTFPPGRFALPNQPVYFLLFYRAESPYAFMVIAASPAIRAALVAALADTIGSHR